MERKSPGGNGARYEWPGRSPGSADDEVTLFRARPPLSRALAYLPSLPATGLATSGGACPLWRCTVPMAVNPLGLGAPHRTLMSAIPYHPRAGGRTPLRL